jgi:outer membrane protein OmpU
MKKILLATTLLAGFAGAASAEVTLSGDARLGVIYSELSGDTAITSRARVTFNLSGESDSGLSFGASFRADNAGGAAAGTAGSVYVSGAFGKLSVGDVDHADAAAVGQVDGVGLTGLGDRNEIDRDSQDAGKVLPAALYEYSAGSFTGYASVDSSDTWAIAGKYAAGNYTVALGYSVDGVDDDTSISLGGSAAFGAVTVKAQYYTYDGIGFADNQYALSATYTTGALAVTAFYNAQNGVGPIDAESYGIGAAYDLGGGAKVVGGLANTSGSALWGSSIETVADLGLSFSF